MVWCGMVWHGYFNAGHHGRYQLYHSTGHVVFEVHDEPTVETATSAIELLLSHSCDCVVAIGGGLFVLNGTAINSLI